MSRTFIFNKVMYTRHYTYNPLGNIITSSTSPSSVSTYVYAGNTGSNYANPHAVTDLASTTKTYDRAGNTTNDGTYTYLWDHNNRLTQSYKGTATSTYGYDHTGARIALKEGTATTTYPNKFYNVGSSITTKHVFANGELIATIESGTSAAAIALDSTASSITTGFNAGPVTKTWTHTTTGSNRFLVLFADIWQDVGGTGTITSATYNGTALTKATNTRGGGMASEIWYLVAPTTGSNTVSVTVTGATDAIKLATASFTGATQTSPLDVSNTATLLQ